MTFQDALEKLKNTSPLRLTVSGDIGSGKSTFMNLLGCLDHPSAGSYWLGGQEVSALSGDELAAVTVTTQPKVTVITSNGSKEQTTQLNDKDLQNHFGKRARMGKALALKGKAVVIGFQS